MTLLSCSAPRGAGQSVAPKRRKGTGSERAGRGVLGGGRCRAGHPGEAGPRMRQWLRARSLPVRVLVYAALATLVFVLAAGVGAVGALALRGDVVGLLEGGQARPTDDRNAVRSGAASGAADPKNAEGGTA